jgi:hypothetical protein
MLLTDELKVVIHLIAHAIARTHGSEDATPFADTVLEHAEAIAADMPGEKAVDTAPAVESLPAPVVDAPADVEQNVIAQ